MTGISIQAHDRGHWTILTVKGPINSYTFTELQDQTNRLVYRRNLAIDLSGVNSMTSAGIGVLLAALEDAEANGRQLAIIEPSEVARLALQSTGFADRFPSYTGTAELPA
jgi:anti-anti-sigma factor